MSAPERIAVVGLGGVFPDSPSPADLWNHVLRAADTCRDVPPGRWLLDPDDAFAPGAPAPDRVYSRRGCFIDGFHLDPVGLDLPADLLAGLDPVFHLALHAGRQAWQSARIDELDRRASASSSATSPCRRRRRPPWLAPCSAAPSPRKSSAPVSKRTRRLIRSMPASRACPPACWRERWAWAAAASRSTRPAPRRSTRSSWRPTSCSRAGPTRCWPAACRGPTACTRRWASRSSGLCRRRAAARPSTPRADGLVVGEGAGVFVLKRLDDALARRRHRPRRHRRRSACPTTSAAACSPRAARASCGRCGPPTSEAGWAPRDVDLIECHATGTPVGDAVEFQSLRTLWGPEGWRPGQCVHRLGEVERRPPADRRRGGRAAEGAVTPCARDAAADGQLRRARAGSGLERSPVPRPDGTARRGNGDATASRAGRRSAASGSAASTPTC